MWRHLVKQRIMRGQSGLALVSVLTLAFVLMVLSVLVLELSLKEMKMTASRRIGAQSFYVAEGGAVSARGALLAFMGADPIACSGCAVIDPSWTTGPADMFGWYANGVAINQNPFAVLDRIVLDSQKFALGATSATTSVTFQVNWSLLNTHLKLLVGAPVSNTLGAGTWKANVVLTLWPQPDNTPNDSCAPFGQPIGSRPSCPIHSLGNDAYEYFYTYTVTSDGQTLGGRRRVTFSGNYSIIVRRQNFARYSLYTNVHLTPAGGAIWFTNNTSFDGPVHTNGEFRFAFFPQFGTPDSGSPCSVARIQSTPLTSVSSLAWFNNSGAPVELTANENVVSGSRVDAPVMPGCDPLNVPLNGSANFTRGVTAITMPANPYSQKGVSVGIDPSSCSPSCPEPTAAQMNAAIPEMAVSPCTSPPLTCPTGIYIPRTSDLQLPSPSISGPMGGGIYIQGNLDTMTLSFSGATAVYTLVQTDPVTLVTQTVTVTVDRTAQQTTVTNSAWTAPTTRTFTGVPKGVQATGNTNAAVVYVEGNITAISGTLGTNEQTTVAASGNINITNHLVYQTPPVVTDPTSNPTNLLGLFSANGDITIDPAAPNDLQINAIMMAGDTSSAWNSSVNVTNYNVGAPRGQIHLIGGIIEKYYGPYGTFNSSTGTQLTGYGRDFKYDRRVTRGFAPPYFPTTSNFEFTQGGSVLAGARPTWREATPP